MNSVKQSQPQQAPIIVMPMLAGLAYALIWLAAGALLLSLLLHLTDMKESELGTYAMIVHGCSSLAGGFTCGKRSFRRGWYNGALLGVLYGIIVIIVSFLAVNASISLHSLLMLGVVLLAGALGGMVGVNMSR